MGNRTRQARLRPFAALLALSLGVGLGACSLLLDLDPEEGHPCQQGRCLPGYRCVDQLCVEAGGAAGITECSPACAEPEACDYRDGACKDLCEASVCPTGSACSPGGPCEPVETGLGAACRSDADCAGAIPGCSTDPDDPGRVLCACFRPATAVEGVCLGLPSRIDDCEACTGGICVPSPFSSSGAGIVCAPGGFRACASDADCFDPEGDARCTYLGWIRDPGARLPDEGPGAVAPLGFLPACASPTEGATLEVGDACEPDAPRSCKTGLCLDDGVHGPVCASPCGSDADCTVGGFERCLDSPVRLFGGSSSMFDVAPVCGNGPSLGAPCGACGLDAPACERPVQGTDNLCSRSCVDDGDCSPERGFSCVPGRALCL